MALRCFGYSFASHGGTDLPFTGLVVGLVYSLGLFGMLILLPIRFAAGGAAVGRRDLDVEECSLEVSRKVNTDSVMLTNVTFAYIEFTSIKIVWKYMHLNVDQCQIHLLMNANLTLINIIYTCKLQNVKSQLHI